MKIIGFNFNNISAEKSENFSKGHISTNMEFTNVEKDKVEALKEADIIKLGFKFSVNYKESSDKNAKTQATVSFQGAMLLSTTKEESKSLSDSWKKKKVPDNMRIPLLNIILKKCSLKALSLEEELNLPTHVPFPRLEAKK